VNAVPTNFLLLLAPDVRSYSSSATTSPSPTSTTTDSIPSGRRDAALSRSLRPTTTDFISHYTIYYAGRGDLIVDATNDASARESALTTASPARSRAETTPSVRAR